MVPLFFWQEKKKKVPSILSIKLYSLENMNYESKMHATDWGLVDLPCFH